MASCLTSQRRRLFVVAGPDPKISQMASPQPEGDLRDQGKGCPDTYERRDYEVLVG